MKTDRNLNVFHSIQTCVIKFGLPNMYLRSVWWLQYDIAARNWSILVEKTDVGLGIVLLPYYNGLYGFTARVNRTTGYYT